MDPILFTASAATAAGFIVGVLTTLIYSGAIKLKPKYPRTVHYTPEQMATAKEQANKALQNLKASHPDLKPEEYLVDPETVKRIATESFRKRVAEDQKAREARGPRTETFTRLGYTVTRTPGDAENHAALLDKAHALFLKQQPERTTIEEPSEKFLMDQTEGRIRKVSIPLTDVDPEVIAIINGSTGQFEGAEPTVIEEDGHLTPEDRQGLRKHGVALHYGAGTEMLRKALGHDTAEDLEEAATRMQKHIDSRSKETPSDDHYGVDYGTSAVSAAQITVVDNINEIMSMGRLGPRHAKPRTETRSYPLHEQVRDRAILRGRGNRKGKHIA